MGNQVEERGVIEVAAHDVPAQRDHAAEVQQLTAEHGHEVELAHDDSGAPERWGWHHEFRTGRQIGGWVSFLILAALLTTTHYNRAGNIALITFMVILAGGLIWDRQRRKRQWRS